MKLKELTLKSTIKCNHQIDVTDLDAEKVMMDLELGRYYMLSKTASYIWELIVSPISIQEVVDHLLDRYEVEPEECKSQVLSLCDALQQLNLIEVY